jgi:hypothetical protein
MPNGLSIAVSNHVIKDFNFCRHWIKEKKKTLKVMHISIFFETLRISDEPILLNM